VVLPLTLLLGYFLAIIYLELKLENFHAWIIGTLLILSGVIVFLMGLKFNGPLDLVAQQYMDTTGSVPNELNQRHGVYGVRMEWWGAGEFLAGAFLFGERISNLF
jgi:hypothetical protein